MVKVLAAVIKTHVASHRWMAELLVRLLVYGTLLVLTHRLADNWFNDADLVHVSLFTLGVCCFELLMVRLATVARYLWLVVCIVVILASGLFLVRQASGLTHGPPQSISEIR